MRRLKLEKKVPTGEQIRGAVAVRDHFVILFAPSGGKVCVDAPGATNALLTFFIHGLGVSSRLAWS